MAEDPSKSADKQAEPAADPAAAASPDTAGGPTVGASVGPDAPSTPRTSEEETEWEKRLQEILEAVRAVVEQNGGNADRQVEAVKKAIEALDKASGSNFTFPKDPEATGFVESLIYTFASNGSEPQTLEDGSVVFKNGRGDLKVGKSGIEFQSAAIKDPDGKITGYQTFTAEDACNMVAAAFLRKDFREKGIVLEGDEKQKLLLQAAIEAANELLPEEMKLKIINPVEGDKPDVDYKEYLLNHPEFRQLAQERRAADPEYLATLQTLDLSDPKVKKEYLGLTPEAISSDDPADIKPNSALALMFGHFNEGLKEGDDDWWDVSDDVLAEVMDKKRGGFANVLVDPETKKVLGLLTGINYKDDEGNVITAVQYTITQGNINNYAERLIDGVLDKEKPWFFEVPKGNEAELEYYKGKNLVKIPFGLTQSRYANSNDTMEVDIYAVFPDGYTPEQKAKALLSYAKSIIRDNDSQAVDPVTDEAKYIKAPADGRFHNPVNAQLWSYYEKHANNPELWTNPEKFKDIKFTPEVDDKLEVSELIQAEIIKRINAKRASIDPEREPIKKLETRQVNYYWNQLTAEEKARLERQAHDPLKLANLKPEQQTARMHAAEVQASKFLDSLTPEALNEATPTNNKAVSKLDKREYPIRETSIKLNGLPEEARTNVQFIIDDKGKPIFIGFKGNAYVKGGNAAINWDIKPAPKSKPGSLERIWQDCQAIRTPTSITIKMDTGDPRLNTLFHLAALNNPNIRTPEADPRLLDRAAIKEWNDFAKRNGLPTYNA